MTRCSACHRKLTNPASIKAGIGPACSKREGGQDAAIDTKTRDLFEDLRNEAINHLQAAANNCRSLGVAITITIN